MQRWKSEELVLDASGRTRTPVTLVGYAWSMVSASENQSVRRKNMAVKKKKKAEKNEIVVVEQVSDHKPVIRDADILNMDYSFDDKIEVATKVAASLKNVIQSQDLAVKIGPSEYVTAEGWEVLGTMLGCTPYVESVEEIPTDKPKFMYKATVSIRQGDTILSRASAMAERNNMQKDRPSVYSMAQTRALGKAYRMALSWIVKMADYEPTPAEEMPRFKPNPNRRAEPTEEDEANIIDVEAK